MEEIDFTKACGCCLSVKDLSLVSDETVKLFVFCFSIQISNCNSSIDSSQFICNLCDRRIKDCYEFRCQILDSQTKLKDLHSSSNFKIEFDYENCKFGTVIKEELSSDLDEAELPSSSIKSYKIDPVSIVDVKFEKKDIEFDMIEKLELSSKINSVKRTTTKDNSKPDTNSRIKFSSNVRFIKKTKSLKKNQPNHKHKFVQIKINKGDAACEICGEKFSSHKLLVTHMGVHYPNYVCDVCKKPFVNKRYFESHVKRHNEKTESCTVCKKIVKSCYLLTHMKIHTGKKQYACPHCSERFESYERRVKHMEKVHKANVYKYICKFCSKEFCMAGNLSKHIRRSHFQEINVTCGICGKGFFHRSEMNAHMVKHTGERNFQCDICSRSYTKKWSLILHMRSHSDNVKKYKCALCNKEFTQKGSLTIHMKNLHKK